MVAGSLKRSAQSIYVLLSRCTWKSVHYFYEPPVSFQHFQRRIFARVDFLEPSSTHTCECSRAGGVPQSPGVATPVTWYRYCTINSQELWIYTLFLNNNNKAVCPMRADVCVTFTDGPLRAARFRSCTATKAATAPLVAET